MSRLRSSSAILLAILLVAGCVRAGSPPPSELSTTSIDAVTETSPGPTEITSTTHRIEPPSGSSPPRSDGPADTDDELAEDEGTERFTVTETVDADGNVVSFPNEPFTLEVSCERIVVVPTVETSVLVYVFREGAVVPEPDEEFSFDGITDRAVLELDPPEGSWAWSVTVVVNDASQVANVDGVLDC